LLFGITAKKQKKVCPSIFEDFPYECREEQLVCDNSAEVSSVNLVFEGPYNIKMFYVESNKLNI
jgi:hypothetical protein